MPPAARKPSGTKAPEAEENGDDEVHTTEFELERETKGAVASRRPRPRGSRRTFGRCTSGRSSGRSSASPRSSR